MAADIAAGTLAPGTRLPTHRALADALGVTVGTISRAYAEAEKRGLTRGEVGRGTFVAGTGKLASPVPPVTGPIPFPLAIPEQRATDFIDMSLNIPWARAEGPRLAETLSAIARDNDLSQYTRYLPAWGLPEHRQAGATWLKRSGVDHGPDRVFVTCGTQHGMLTSVVAVARPGDVILSESLTFAGLASLCEQLNFNLQGLALDEEGLIPEAFEAACRLTRPRALYCIPTQHNPTTATMSTERRKAIAEIAIRNDVIIIEDDIYGGLPGERPPAISSFAPDHTILVTSTSKVLGGGLRIGFADVPERLQASFENALRISTWSAPPLTAEVVRRWLEDGTVDLFLDWHRTELARIHKAADALLPGGYHRGDPASLHMWLTPPRPWTGERFAAEMRRRGVAALSGEAFRLASAPGAENEKAPPEGVRLCICGTASAEKAIEGLGIVGEILREPTDANRPPVSHAVL